MGCSASSARAAIMAEAADYLGNANGGSVLPGMEQEVSREVIRVLKEQYEKTLQILTRWQGALETLAGELIRRRRFRARSLWKSGQGLSIWYRLEKGRIPGAAGAAGILPFL